MGELKYTPLRHKILTEVSKGRMRLYHGLHWNLTRGQEFLRGAEKRCEMDVLPLVNKPDSPSSWNSARLTEEGHELLAKWNSKHGNVELPAR
jgi:hypothetical protein